MRRLFALILVALALLLVAFLLLVRPALAGTPRCTTYEEKTMSRLQTLCADGTRAVSTWNRTLERWDTIVTPPPSSVDDQRHDPHRRVRPHDPR